MSTSIIEIKKCSCGTEFSIIQDDIDFLTRISPVIEGIRYDIPTPKICPECRNQRRLAWRNRRYMYRRTCDASGKNIISMFRPGTPYKVYHVKEWESDKWDPKRYGKEFDFSKSFFEQYDELLKTVPFPHLAVIESTLENADYVNGANAVKNAYLSNNIVSVEDVYYSEDIYDSKLVIDSLSLRNSEDCYECVNSMNIFGCEYLYECESCTRCSFCKFCTGCNDCIGCINLTNKDYHIFNKPYSKEEYEIEKNKLTKTEIQKGFDALLKTSPYKFAKIIKSQNVVGDNIINSKDIINSFDIYDSENIKNSTFLVGNCKDCQDITFWGQEINLCYEGAAVGINSSKVLFSCETYDHMTNCFYCYFCYPNSSNLFGCIGIRSSEYCILNKQYTKEEYEILLPKIIEHMKNTSEWGEFFPANMSPFGYNETVANEYYPMEREDAILPCRDVARYVSTDMNHISTDIKPQFNWSDYEPPKPDVSKIIPGSKLPEDIADIPEDILNWAIECEETGKPFRIIKPELDFYRKHNLPIPKKHPDIRHMDRVKQRNPRKLYERKCMKCSIDIKTTYSPERPEIVYCEDCYNKEVI